MGRYISEEFKFNVSDLISSEISHVYYEISAISRQHNIYEYYIYDKKSKHRIGYNDGSKVFIEKDYKIYTPFSLKKY